MAIKFKDLVKVGIETLGVPAAAKQAKLEFRKQLKYVEHRALAFVLTVAAYTLLIVGVLFYLLDTLVLQRSTVFVGLGIFMLIASLLYRVQLLSR